MFECVTFDLRALPKIFCITAKPIFSILSPNK